MFLIDTIKPNVEKEIQNLFYFFTQLFRGGESQAYKIKPVLFISVLCFLAATKTLFKTNDKGRYLSIMMYNTKLYN